MPRAPRIDVPGLVYHVTNRGANKQDLFLSPQDYVDFLRIIAQTCDEFPFMLHAYCLMTNHFHLLLQTIDDSLSQTIQYLTGLYGQLFNRRYGRSGRLHQGRFHSIPVQEDSYFTVAARCISSSIRSKRECGGKTAGGLPLEQLRIYNSRGSQGAIFFSVEIPVMAVTPPLSVRQSHSVFPITAP